MTSAEPALSFRPATRQTWPDFDALFSAPGGPKHCWCMVWRRTPEELKQHPNGRTRKPLIKGRVDRGETIGLIGYLEGKSVAWVSVAPRETYRELGGQPAEVHEAIWSLACFYLKRELRGRGHGDAMLAAAIGYARDRGATVIEAYPVDPDSPSYRFMGFVPAFERLGFEPVGTAGSRRHIMRLELDALPQNRRGH